MFQRGRNSVREAYKDPFMRDPGNGREVTFHRVVNIVERSCPMPLMGGDRRGPDDQWYNDYIPYQGPRECQGNIPQRGMRCFQDESSGFMNFRRNSSPPRNDGQYSPYVHNRNDLRHHLDSRNNSRGGNFFRNRGCDPGPSKREDLDYRRRDHFTFVRDRSPLRRASNSSSSGSRPTEINFSNQQNPKTTPPASPPPSSPVEEPLQAATPSEENPPDSAAKLEEVVAASVEPEPTPEEDLKARRLEAIKAKALEIEKDYRQDCETFRTVVKMLVSKEPSLDYLLQAPLEKNLEEIKERSLDSLKHFMKELDEVIEQPSMTEQDTESKAGS